MRTSSFALLFSATVAAPVVAPASAASYTVLGTPASPSGTADAQRDSATSQTTART
jgi:hypothetical protein